MTAMKRKFMLQILLSGVLGAYSAFSLFMIFWNNRSGLGQASPLCKAACQFAGKFNAATSATDRPQCCIDALDGRVQPWCNRNYVDDEWCACATYTIVSDLTLFFMTACGTGVCWLEIGSVYRRHLRDMQNMIPDQANWDGWKAEHQFDSLISLCSLGVAGGMSFGYSLVAISYASGDPCAWARLRDYASFTYAQLVWSFIMIMRHSYGCGKYLYKRITLTNTVDTVQTIPTVSPPTNAPVLMTNAQSYAPQSAYAYTPQSPSGTHAYGNPSQVYTGINNQMALHPNSHPLHPVHPTHVPVLVHPQRSW